MNKNFQVNNLSEAVNNVILPKLEKYLEDRKSDISLREKIDAIVDKINDYEALVNDFVSNDLEDGFQDTVGLGRYWFRYDPDLDTYIYTNSKVQTAENEVYGADGLWNSWSIKELIQIRIKAIITTLDTTSFDQVLKIVESQIDFNEFITKE